MTHAIASLRARELTERGEPFVAATVVRAQRPTSVRPGNVALVLADGTLEGFVGGVCAQETVRAYSLRAIATGEAVLLRILPDGTVGDDGAEREDASQEGAVTVQNTCLSGGAIEVFLEPVLPAPRLLVVGTTPIATAVRSIGAELGLEVVTVDGDEEPVEPVAGDLALVVAAHGRDELHALRRGLELGVPYVGLVASRKRGAAVIAMLEAQGVPADALARVDVPAGLDIGSRTPAEVALSILAEIVAVRRGKRGDAPGPAPSAIPAPVIAIDPICGMEVVVGPETPTVEHDGETFSFCCKGCAARFRAQLARAAAPE